MGAIFRRPAVWERSAHPGVTHAVSVLCSLPLLVSPGAPFLSAQNESGTTGGCKEGRVVFASEWALTPSAAAPCRAMPCRAELKDNFSLFVKMEDGKINLSELGTVLRALGLNPTEAEVKTIQAKMDPSGGLASRGERAGAGVGPRPSSSRRALFSRRRQAHQL